MKRYRKAINGQVFCAYICNSPVEIQSVIMKKSNTAPLLTPIILGCFLFLTMCKDQPTTENRCDRKLMLQNYAEQLILPGFQKVSEHVSLLRTEWNSFENLPDNTGVIRLQQQWAATYRAWIAVSAFNFGPAAAAGLKLTLQEEIGVFPADRNRIESQIAAQDYSTDNAFRNARGLLALEYLLYRQPELLVDHAERRNYLDAVLQHLENEVNKVNNGWQTEKDAFIADTGSDAGGSLSVLYNGMLGSFEGLKNYKIGAPMGLNNFFMAPEPELVEGYYSGLSLEFVKLHLQNIETIYEGAAPEGVGLRDYLECLEGGPALITSINASLQNIHNRLDAIPTDKPLSDLMVSVDPSILPFYNALKDHVHFFGSDMSSVLGIAITFDSGDGD